jgi:SGNH hydrolase-like domain, acetyltransferase AlgX
MNTSNQQLKNYLAIFSITALLPIIIFGAIGFFLQPLSGDLTRLGRLAERDFGWNVPQPIVEVFPMNRAEVADVIVLGDSFSQPNVWQSITVQRTKLKLLTFSFLNMREPGCIEQWVKSIPVRYPSAKTIIIETTEKSFLDRFNVDINKCRGLSIFPYTYIPGQTASERQHGYKDIMPDPIYALRAAFNSDLQNNKAARSGDTIIQPLNRNDLFSNHRADLLLYYKTELDKKNWKPLEIETALNRISSLEQIAAANKMQFIINIVPDKSTIYSRFFKNQEEISILSNLQKELRLRNIRVIDLLPTLNANVESIKDLYLPNDTHFSTSGYILMGEAIAQELSNNSSK